MEVSSSIVGGLVSQTGEQEQQVAVLKKALEAEASAAKELIQAIPQPQPVTHNNPPHLGQNVDTKA